MTAFSEWQNFYVIVGSSAGALIGLQFVMIALIADMPVVPDQAQAGQTFATPTIVHFTAVLVLAGIMSAPWQGSGPVRVLWAVLGAAGVLFILRVAWRMPRQAAYTPEPEDWIFHAVLPLIAYAGLLAAGCVGVERQRAALFGVGTAAIVLLLIGIHNAWDSVSYHVFVRRQRNGEH